SPSVLPLQVGLMWSSRVVGLAWPCRVASLACSGLVLRSGSGGARSPFGEGAVGVAPDRGAPAMADGGARALVVLVDLAPQPRPGRDGHHAVPIVEDGAVHHVVEQVVVGVVMDAQALLLDEGVVGPGVDLQAGGQGD